MGTTLSQLTVNPQLLHVENEILEIQLKSDYLYMVKDLKSIINLDPEQASVDSALMGWSV